MPTHPKLPLRWSRDDAPAPSEQYPIYNLFLGAAPRAVGALVVWNWPQKGDLRWRFSWTCHLPGLDLAPGGTEAAETRTFEEARAGLVEVVENWFVRAGLVGSVDPALPAEPAAGSDKIGLDPNAVLALAIFHAERGDTSMIERLRAERVEDQIQSVVSAAPSVAVGSPRFRVAAQEYLRWATGFDSRRPAGARSWVCRFGENDSCVEVSSHETDDDAEKARHQQALAAAISAALTHVEDAENCSG